MIDSNSDVMDMFIGFDIKLKGIVTLAPLIPTMKYGKADFKFLSSLLLKKLLGVNNKELMFDAI
jgi:hypothetical protein